MKKIVLLVSLCCFGFITRAQKFLIEPLRHYGDTTVIMCISDQKIRENRDLLLRYVTSDFGKRFSQHEEVRKKWLKQIKTKIFTRELRHSLKDTSVLADKIFWIRIYFDKDGTVFTVTFEVEKDIYKLLSEKWMKETFNCLMKERINTTEFWDFSSSESDDLARMDISVRDFFRGKIRDQKELNDHNEAKKLSYPPCGTFTTKRKLGR